MPKGLLEKNLARLSAEEMLDALGLGRAPSVVRVVARAALSFASVPMGRVLARFDEQIAERGIREAAAMALEDLGARWTCEKTVPSSGALLVVANHPGAYDALVLLAALGRRDVAIVANDRPFLRALPNLARHLAFVPDTGPHHRDRASRTPRSGETRDVPSRARAARLALRHLEGGGAIVHFGAGRIEPDPAFSDDHPAHLLEAWPRGTGLLVRGAARARGVVVAAIVAGVHSPKAKRLVATRLAERRGITTLAPLLQVAVPAYRDVWAVLHLSDAASAQGLARGAGDPDVTARVRSMALEVLERSREQGPRGRTQSRDPMSAK
jgi:hypothetical protein